MKIDRRHFMVVAAASSVAQRAPAFAQTGSAVPIIETTIHLYDPTRPQGAPYKRDPAGVDAAKFRQEAPPGIVGAVAIESSPWLEDNLWLLQACAKDSIMVGCIGNLHPEAPDFAEYLDRFSKDPLFRGIRYGNIWKYNLVEQAKNPVFIAGLKRLAHADLALDICNPKVDLLRAAIRLNDAVPNLRIIVDHLAGFYPAVEEKAVVREVLSEYSRRPTIFGKISAFDLGQGNKTPPLTLANHKERLDTYFEAFGEDRLIGGGWTSETISLCRSWMEPRGVSALQKLFWQNSIRAYKWLPRAPNQPRLF